MRIGFVSIAYPEDPNKSVVGLYKRMGMFIQAMKDHAELDMLFYVRPDLAIDAHYVGEMERLLSQQWDARLRLQLCHMEPVPTPTGPWQKYIEPALSIAHQVPYLKTAQNKQIDAAKRMLAQKPDIVFVHRLSSMIPILLAKASHPRIYFDMDDIEHVAYSRAIKQPPQWPSKRLYYLRLPILKLWERRAIRHTHTTFICSEHDRRYIARVYGCNNVTVIHNAIEIPAVQAIADNPYLLFLGTMSYEPNRAAADYLIRHIWPSISAAVPEARLLIAGANPESIPSFHDNPPKVEFRGFIDDLGKLYQEVMVVCCPILAGGGTRIKILEAAAYGKPVVSTTIGAEGIELQDGEEIFLRDDPRSFADACIQLLKDSNLVVKIGQNARAVITQHYDRNDVINRIRKCLTESGGYCD